MSDDSVDMNAEPKAVPPEDVPEFWIRPHYGLPLLSVIVFVTAWIGIMATRETGRVAMIWLPNGAVVAFLLYSRLRCWPAYVSAAFVANLFANLLAGDRILSAIALSSLNSLEILIAAGALRHRLGQASYLGQPVRFVAFCVMAVGVAPAITAVLASEYLWFLESAPRAEVFLRWLMGDALGMAIVAPLVSSILRHDFFDLFSAAKIPKTLFWLAATMLVTIAVFYQTRYPFLFMLPPVLLAGAVTMGYSFVALCLPILTAIVTVATIAEHGPFALVHEVTLEERIQLGQLFVIVNFLTASFTGNIATARRRLEVELAVKHEKLRAANRDLSRLATTDGLTEIANRRSFDLHLSQEWLRMRRQGAPLSLLLMDVDHFKRYNDHYGHPAGDECLKTLAVKISTFARRPGDMATRYGGEEMALILPDCDNANAKRIAENVRRAIEALKIPHSGNSECGGVVTVSIGVATCDPRTKELGHNEETIVKLADMLLYEAKRTGRNRVVAAESLTADTAQHSWASEERRIAMVEKFVADGEIHSRELDNIAFLAATMLNAPIALVSLVGRDNQKFLGRFGLSVTQTSRDVSFCAHTLNGTTPLVVNDATADARFAANALVTGDMGLRFYAGAPLVTSADGIHLGALCIIDKKPRQDFDGQQKMMLSALAQLAMKILETETSRDQSVPADQEQAGSSDGYPQNSAVA